MNEKDGWVEFRNLKGVKDLRYFLEEDEWGQDWVTKFFRADYADEPLPEMKEEFRENEDSAYSPWDREDGEQQAGEY